MSQGGHSEPLLLLALFYQSTPSCLKVMGWGGGGGGPIGIGIWGLGLGLDNSKEIEKANLRSEKNSLTIYFMGVIFLNVGSLSW